MLDQANGRGGTGQTSIWGGTDGMALKTRRPASASASYPTPILRIHPPQDIRTDPMGITDSDDQPFQPPVSPPERIIIREQSPAPPLPPADRAGAPAHATTSGYDNHLTTGPPALIMGTPSFGKPQDLHVKWGGMTGVPGGAGWRASVHS